MHTAVIKLDNQGDFNCQLNCHPRPRLQLAEEGAELHLTHPMPFPTSSNQHQSQPEPGGVGKVSMGGGWAHSLILTDGLSPRALAHDFSRGSHTGDLAQGPSFHGPEWR